MKKRTVALSVIEIRENNYRAAAIHTMIVVRLQQLRSATCGDSIRRRWIVSPALESHVLSALDAHMIAASRIQSSFVLSKSG